MKFATKLTLLFSGLFLILCAFITQIATSSSGEILESTIENQMQARAAGKMDKIDKVLFERLADMKMLANDPLLKSKTPSPKLIEERFETLFKNNDSYTSLSYFDMSRKRIVDTSRRDVGKIHSRSEYWPEIESGKDSVIDIYYSESLNAPTFHVATVVKNSAGARVGVLVARMSIDWLTEIIKPPTLIQPFDKILDERGLMGVDMVNRTGLVIYSNHDTGNILERPSAYWKYVKDDVGRGIMNKGYRLRLSGMGEEIVTFGHEKGYRNYMGNGWTIIVHVPSEVVFAPVAALRNRLIIHMAAMGGFSILVILVFARSISKPLMKLSAAAKEIGRGNLDVKVWVDSKDEVAALAKDMNRMAKNISDSHHALRRSEESHRKLFENAGDFIYSHDLSGNFTSLNKALCERIGYRPEELIGAPISKIVHPESLEKARVMTEAKLRGEISHTQYEILIAAKNGEIILTELHSWLIFENGKPVGVQGIGRDISEHRAAEEKLRQSEEWFRALIENQNDLVFVIDEIGNFKYLGPSVERMTGYTPGELQASKGLNFIHPDDIEAVKQSAMKAAQNPGMPVSLELRLQHKNGNWKTITSTGTGYLENPAIRGIIINFHDITERKLAEKRLEIAKETAEAATMLKDQFITLVSHDLKTPILSIRGVIDLVTTGAIRQEKKINDLLGQAAHSADGLLRMIDQLLEHNSLKSGKNRAEKRFHSASRLTGEQIQRVGLAAKNKNITLANDLPPDMLIFVDGGLFGQALNNLLSNAVKFTPKGGRVRLFAPLPGKPVIAVRDTGVGLPPEMLDSLFQTETHSTTVGTAGEKGFGLGLGYAQAIVLMHGGTLRAESQTGKGSTFTISLPEHRALIMVVDDLPSHRERIKGLLAALGPVEVIEAGNGREAWEKLRPVAPDLVITDIQMPVMDGYAFMVKMRSEEAFRPIPVIVLSTQTGLPGETAERDKAILAGADEFLQKAASDAVVLETIRKYIRPIPS